MPHLFLSRSRHPRDRDVCADALAVHRNRPATPVARLSTDLRAVQGRDRRRSSAPRRSRTRAARPGDATEYGARHGRTGLHGPGRRGLSANARRGRHVRLTVPAGLAEAAAARPRRIRRARQPATCVSQIQRHSAATPGAADCRRAERRAASAATRSAGARRISAQGLAPACVAARAKQRTRTARLSESRRLPAAARTHRDLSDALARRHLRAGTGVRYRRLSRHTGTHTAQPRTGGRARVVRGSRLSARTRVPVRDRRTTRPSACGRRRDRRRTRHAAGRAGTLRARDAVASEPAGAYAVAVPPHCAARLGRNNVGVDPRGRLRQRVSLSRPAAARVEEPRPARSRDLLQYLQQGDVPRSAARLRGRA